MLLQDMENGTGNQMLDQCKVVRSSSALTSAALLFWKTRFK